MCIYIYLRKRKVAKNRPPICVGKNASSHTTSQVVNFPYYYFPSVITLTLDPPPLLEPQNQDSNLGVFGWTIHMGKYGDIG